jgi:hypothetical protein
LRASTVPGNGTWMLCNITCNPGSHLQCKITLKLCFPKNACNLFIINS